MPHSHPGHHLSFIIEKTMTTNGRGRGQKPRQPWKRQSHQILVMKSASGTVREMISLDQLLYFRLRNRLRSAMKNTNAIIKNKNDSTVNIKND